MVALHGQAAPVPVAARGVQECGAAAGRLARGAARDRGGGRCHLGQDGEAGLRRGRPVPDGAPVAPEGVGLLLLAPCHPGASSACVALRPL